MRIGYEIAQFLKEIKSPTNNERHTRSMVVANALGYHYSLNGFTSIEEAIDHYIPEVKKIISSVNENITLNTQLTIELFKQCFRIRYALINGVTDPAIIQAAQTSQTAIDYQTPIETSVSQFLVNNSEFARRQNNITNILKQLAANE